MNDRTAKTSKTAKNNRSHAFAVLRSLWFREMHHLCRRCLRPLCGAAKPRLPGVVDYIGRERQAQRTAQAIVQWVLCRTFGAQRPPSAHAGLTPGLPSAASSRLETPSNRVSRQ